MVREELKKKLNKFTHAEIIEDLSEYFGLKKFRNKNPLTLMAIFEDSILTGITKEYFVVIILHILLTNFLTIDIVKDSKLYLIVKKLSDYFDKFPADIIAFPLSFCLSQILLAKTNVYENYVVYLNNFAFFCYTHISDENERMKIIKAINKMVAISFRRMEEDVDLKKMEYAGEKLFEDGELDQLTYNNMNYFSGLKQSEYFYAKKIMNIAEKNATLKDGEMAELFEKVSEIAGKCQKLKQYNLRKVSFVHFSSVIYCCNIYLLHLFLDFIPFDGHEKEELSYLVFTIKFIIFYGWPKVGTYSYHPFGNSFGKINLKKIAEENYSSSMRIAFSNDADVKDVTDALLNPDENSKSTW